MNSNYVIYNDKFREVKDEDKARLDGFMHAEFGSDWNEKEQARKYLQEVVKEENFS